MQGADDYRQAYDLVGQLPFLHADPLLKICECVRQFVKNWLTALQALGGAAFHPGQDNWPFGRRPQDRGGATGRAPVNGCGRLTGALSTARRQMASRR